MKRLLFATLLAAAMLIVPAFTVAPAPAHARGLNMAAIWLYAHNRERVSLGMPVLRWNDQLAVQAQGWADTLAQRGAFEHSRDRGATGENLWMGTSGYFGADEMIGHFLAEKRDFQPGRFPNIARNGNWQSVGHYTQIIWKETREVGCALAKGRGRDVLVCRYWPAGNVNGQFVG